MGQEGREGGREGEGGGRREEEGDDEGVEMKWVTWYSLESVPHLLTADQQMHPAASELHPAEGRREGRREGEGGGGGGSATEK